MTENEDGPTFDVEEFKRRIRVARDALVQAEDYCTTWEEAERKKRECVSPDFQTE
jgi:hypothetical protein